MGNYTIQNTDYSTFLGRFYDKLQDSRREELQRAAEKGIVIVTICIFGGYEYEVYSVKKDYLRGFKASVGFHRDARGRSDSYLEGSVKTGYTYWNR